MGHRPRNMRHLASQALVMRIVRWRSVAALFIALLLACAPVAGHDLPMNAIMNAFVKVEPAKIDLVVRIPLDLLRGVPFPVKNGQYDLAYKLDRTTTAAGAYPLALVSYHIVCARYTDVNAGNLVVAFEKYVVSAAGQDMAASAAGSAPIGDKVGALALASVNSIKVG